MEDIERGKLIYNYKLQFMGNRNLEFLHELIGAKTEDISNDEDAIC